MPRKSGERDCSQSRKDNRIGTAHGARLLRWAERARGISVMAAERVHQVWLSKDAALDSDTIGKAGPLPSARIAG
jgi:hypothetical protein